MDKAVTIHFIADNSSLLVEMGDWCFLCAGICGIEGFLLAAESFQKAEDLGDSDTLIEQCRRGSKDIPVDCEEAEYWKKRKQGAMT